MVNDYGLIFLIQMGEAMQMIKLRKLVFGFTLTVLHFVVGLDYLRY